MEIFIILLVLALFAVGASLPYRPGSIMFYR
jgi:hypothetical protein